jgi:predicted MFS family arabinose efflux permease
MSNTQNNICGPLDSINNGAMKSGQWLIVAICLGLLALDGYDVLSISFAAPGMTEEWGLSKAALGVILPLELLGMAFGSIFMGSFADNKGRKPVILVSLLLVTLGMLLSGLAANVYILGSGRILTGIGVGGMLAAVPATAAEYCNNKNRSLAVIFVAGGYSFGIYLGATFLAPLLKQYDWRITFYLGAAISFFFIPIVYFFAPETISYLNRKRPKGALGKIQTILKKLGHDTIEKLGPVPSNTEEKISPITLFKPHIAVVTIILTLAYFGNIGTYYYYVKWLPTIVTDLGYTKSEATSVLGMISLGGVFGSIGVGLIARFVSIKPLMLVTLLSSAIGVALFPYFAESLSQLKMVGFVTGLMIFGAISGFFGLFVAAYPTSLLSAGTGFVLGIGRGGAVLGPFIPGLLFTAGLDLKMVAIIMATGSFIAAFIILFLPKISEEVIVQY